MEGTRSTGRLFGEGNLAICRVLIVCWIPRFSPFSAGKLNQAFFHKTFLHRKKRQSIQPFWAKRTKMEEIANNLRHALEVIFLNAGGTILWVVRNRIGNQNLALQWVQEFQNSENAIEVTLYLLNSGSLNDAILFGALKILVERFYQSWNQIISFIWIKSSCPSQPECRAYAINLRDLHYSLITQLLLSSSHNGLNRQLARCPVHRSPLSRPSLPSFCLFFYVSHPENIFSLCEEQKLEAPLFLHISATLPHTLHKLTNYLSPTFSSLHHTQHTHPKPNSMLAGKPSRPSASTAASSSSPPSPFLNSHKTNPSSNVSDSSSPLGSFSGSTGSTVSTVSTVSRRETGVSARIPSSTTPFPVSPFPPKGFHRAFHWLTA